MSMRSLGKTMGVSHSQLSSILSGKRKMQLNEAALLSQIFGQAIHRIIENAGVFVQPVGARRAQVVGVVQGDGTVQELVGEAIERTAAPENLPHKAVAVQMRTALSDLAWMDGATLFCAEPNGIDEAAIGRLCLVQIKNGPSVVAVVQRGYAPDRFHLSGPYSQQDVRLDWASQIIFTKH